MREYYVLKSQSHDTDTPTYMEALSGKMRNNTSRQWMTKFKVLWEGTHGRFFSRKSVADNNMIPGTFYFKWKRKPDWTISKSKSKYSVRGNVQKRLSHKPLNLYSTVVQWDTVRLILILHCILGFQIQSIDFTKLFSQVDIPSREPLFIELPRDFNSDGGQGDVVLSLNKSLYGQA